jgi:hypothetical protein
MASTNNIYQSILHKLSEIPVAYLEDIDSYLEKLTAQTSAPVTNRVRMLSLAGSWNDMDEETFNEYLQVAKSAEITSREVDI